MNRDRTLIVVLAVLLAVSLFFNWRWWKKSQDGGAQTAVVAAPAQAEARKSAPPGKGTQGAYAIVANPDMKGRLGRIVLAFAEGANIDTTRTSICKGGTAEVAKTAYGAVAAELPPGNYDLHVFGKKIDGIPVESGKDTRVRSGVLRLHGSDNTRFSVSDVGLKNTVHVAYGNSAFGLPTGEYEIEVAGQREKFTIEAGKITDF